MRERKRIRLIRPAPVIEEAPYVVGYGRPPKASQFKAGISGNPKGRPKGAKNLSTLAHEKLQAKVLVREGGRERRMSKAEIGMTKMVNKFAETGDPRLAQFLDRLTGGDAKGDTLRAHEAAGTPRAEAAPSDQAILDWYLEKHRADGEAG